MVEVNNKTAIAISQKKVKILIKKFLKEYQKDKFVVSVAFVKKSEIRRLNKIYRNIDKSTDILSFAGYNNFLGEIIISPEVIKEQARLFKKTFLQELNFIIIHGLLHLIGYQDNTEKKRLKMILEGEKFLKKYYYV